jgi:FKBP-type peptidyl-prolyl cis-trans isomerase 2
MTGLEEAVIGMDVGDSKSVTVTPDTSYKDHQIKKVQTVDRSQFPPGLEPKTGLQFEVKQEDGTASTVRVTEVTETNVTLEATYSLAGQDLSFEIEMLEIRTNDPNLAEEYFKKGVECHNEGRLDEAISYYQNAVKENPKLAQVYYNMGVALQQKGQVDQANTCYEVAIGLNQKFTEAHHNLGITFYHKKQFDEAIICFLRVLQLKPDHVGAYYNLGNIFFAKGQLSQAREYYQKTVSLQPDHTEALWNIAILNLLSGNFAEGLKGYELRGELKGALPPRNFIKPRWNGSDLKGKTILLHAEQDIGDTVQFIRYAPLVAQKGASVVVECQKEISSLLKDIKGIDKVISRGDPLPDFDTHCPLISLPLLFGTTLDTIPADIPYIMPGADNTARWKEKTFVNPAGIKIGIAWAGDRGEKDDLDLSCGLRIFSPLSSVQGVSFFSLQRCEAPNPPEGMQMTDLTDLMNDFSDTAALIANLDLVISADTPVAHLAGAMGKPVWVILPFIPDWRWMLDREDSPWYPTMRLFRQPAPGDWETVLKNVKKAPSEYPGPG